MHSVRHTRFVPGACGAAVTVVVGLLAGLTGWPDLPVVLALAGFAFGWELVVERQFLRRWWRFWWRWRIGRLGLGLQGDEG